MTHTAWHPAFLEAIQLELEDYRDVLLFESEHQLTTEPLKIDVLIIKKRRNIVIEKNIAQIFRANNIIEYKSPDDYISIDDYHKTHCYSRLYAVLNKTDIDEMSVTLVSTKQPRKLLGYLENRYKVTSSQSGIYIVEGDTSPTQIVVSSELTADENLWLTSLTKELTAARLIRILTATAKRGKDAARAYIDVVASANVETFQEIIMRKTVDSVLKELGYIDKWIAEGKAEGIAKGKAEGKAEGIAKGKAEGKAEGIAEGEARGKAEGQILAILCVLKARFGSIPMKLQNRLFRDTDLTRLETLITQAAICPSLNDFEKQMR